MAPFGASRHIKLRAPWGEVWSTVTQRESAVRLCPFPGTAANLLFYRPLFLRGKLSEAFGLV